MNERDCNRCVWSRRDGGCNAWDCDFIDQATVSKTEQVDDYTELKREFLRMASYIDCLLVCSDEQKETLIGFISRMAEMMPWTERD